MFAIAFTGGPGFGKSTTLATLAARGYECVPESARAVIQERVSQGLSKRPAAAEFAEQILARDQAEYRRVQETQGPVFFDRSVIDALGMYEALGLLNPVRLELMLSEYPFHRTAFVFPPWRDIYAMDAERDQTFEEAVAVDDAVRKWYRHCGFDLIEVPRVDDVHARSEFILARLPFA
jgi:predicted ATPase